MNWDGLGFTINDFPEGDRPKVQKLQSLLDEQEKKITAQGQELSGYKETDKNWGKFRESFDKQFTVGDDGKILLKQDAAESFLEVNGWLEQSLTGRAVAPGETQVPKEFRVTEHEKEIFGVVHKNYKEGLEPLMRETFLTIEDAKTFGESLINSNAIYWKINEFKQKDPKLDPSELLAFAKERDLGNTPKQIETAFELYQNKKSKEAADAEAARAAASSGAVHQGAEKVSGAGTIAPTTPPGSSEVRVVEKDPEKRRALATQIAREKLHGEGAR